MPAWFIDIESATEAQAKSKATPPAARTAAQASRANSPRSALHGVTRPSVEATPMNGFARSVSERPRARRNARCGARSRPSTVMREGSLRGVIMAASHSNEGGGYGSPRGYGSLLAGAAVSLVQRRVMVAGVSFAAGQDHRALR